MAKKLIPLTLEGGNGNAKRTGAKLYRVHYTISVAGTQAVVTRNWTALTAEEAGRKTLSALKAFVGITVVNCLGAEEIG